MNFGDLPAKVGWLLFVILALIAIVLIIMVAWLVFFAPPPGSDSVHSAQLSYLNSMHPSGFRSRIVPRRYPRRRPRRRWSGHADFGPRTSRRSRRWRCRTPSRAPSTT